jgi:hypothetical protein
VHKQFVEIRCLSKPSKIFSVLDVRTSKSAKEIQIQKRIKIEFRMGNRDPFKLIRTYSLLHKTMHNNYFDLKLSFEQLTV